MICPNCGSQLPDEAAFCGSCGGAIAGRSAQRQQGWQQSVSAPPVQQGYQQPYGQQRISQQELPEQTATNRAFAMTIYAASLLGVIFALCVRDKDNAFITHHLNNAAVILIGGLVGSLLSVALIGFVVLIYLFAMMIMGVVSAYNGDMKELPLIGKIHIVK